MINKTFNKEVNSKFNKARHITEDMPSSFEKTSKLDQSNRQLDNRKRYDSELPNLLHSVLDKIIELELTDKINNAWEGELFALSKDNPSEGYKYNITLERQPLSDDEYDWLISELKE